MANEVNAQEREPDYSFTLEDLDRIARQRMENRRKELRKMSKTELIEYIIGIENHPTLTPNQDT